MTSQQSRWFRAGLWLLQFCLFGLWCLLGPYGPLPSYREYRSIVQDTTNRGLTPCAYCGKPGTVVSGDKRITACELHQELAKANEKPNDPGNRLGLGVIWFLLGSALPFSGMLDAFKEVFGRKTWLRDHFKTSEDFLNSALFLAGLCVIFDVIVVLFAGRWAEHPGEVVPLLKNSITWSGLAIFAACAGSWSLYSTALLCPELYREFSSTSPTTSLRIIATFLYPVICFSVSCLSVLVAAGFVFLLARFWGAAFETFGSEVAREHGPGLSRRLPYGLLLAAGGLMMFIASIWLLFVMPVVSSIALRRKFQSHDA